MNQDTIVAIATPPGRGGVGIVRVSGPLALELALKISNKPAISPRTAIYTPFYDLNQEVMDEGVLLYFKAPHSFTGEEVIEFQGHGSPIVLDNLVKNCVALGARMARPGEFSERAFLNDKMDLAQAEAVADLIHASTETAARMALRSLQGEFSKLISALNEDIIYLRRYVEAAIDFPEEEVDFLQDGKILRLLEAILEKLHSIRKQAMQGVIVREGISVVIAGRPNAGKSTLINALSGLEVAIVTDIAGTTRDVMRQHIHIDGMPLHLIDTAGIRASEDAIEQVGISRAWQEIKKCDCVLLVVDLTDTESTVTLDEEIKLALPKDAPILKVYNKIDALGLPSKIESNAVYLCAKSGEGLEALKSLLKNTMGYQPLEGQFMARGRHLEALNQAQAVLEKGYVALKMHQAGELLAQDLRDAHAHLCTITGEFTADDLLGEIFSSFCIGK